MKAIEYWQNAPGCRQSKNCIKICKKKAKYLINISRTRLKIYTGVMTEHYGFNKQLVTIGKRTNPSCELCDYHTDSAEHYLCNCPAFIHSRRKFLGNYIINYKIISHFQPHDILKYITSTGRFE